MISTDARIRRNKMKKRKRGEIVVLRQGGETVVLGQGCDEENAHSRRVEIREILGWFTPHEQVNRGW